MLLVLFIVRIYDVLCILAYPYLTLILKKEAFATVVGRHILDKREECMYRKECFESKANQNTTISGMVATLFLDSLLSFLLIATWKALLHLTF